MNASHFIVMPVVLPLAVGAALVAIGRRRAALAGTLGVASCAALLVLAALLAARAHEGGATAVYLLGNWHAVFGVSLVLDRLAALMLVLTALVGLVCAIYSRGGDDARGAHFHALLQFQLMGLNGAFLTADLFNLFVFFEVLLISSYGLLLHGAGPRRLRASVHAVTINLTGSALFLIAVSLLYGLAGTLNMAELAARLPHLGADRAALVRSAAMLLLVVFCLKAALLPLNFWLPSTYAAATAPVGALFAIMTKVGVYAVARMSTLAFGDEGGAAANASQPWLGALALATLALGAIGALAATELRGIVVSVIVVSAGTLLLGIALGSPAGLAAMLFYMVNATLAAAALFLLADRIDRMAQDRSAPASKPAGAIDTRRTAAPAIDEYAACAILFFVFAVAAAGLPPLGGFIGKAWLLQAAGAAPIAAWAITTLLASALLVLVALSRSGSRIFWNPKPLPAGDASTLPWRGAHRAALASVLVALVACAVNAGAIGRYVKATAQQVFDRRAYMAAVLGAQPVPAAIDVRREMRDRDAAKPQP